MIENFIPYFRPEPQVTSCYSMYMDGVNVKREMVLLPNDGEVASSEKHSQFKTRVHINHMKV